jgi:hypothetical protein
MNRQALLILGVHRSGTSAMTGAVIQLGARAPKTLMRTEHDNPLGHWESDAFYQFHERLLKSAGTEWSDWTRINPAWFGSPAADEFAAELQALLEQEFGRAPLFAVKDPRVCRFVPFWLRNLEDAGVTTTAAILTIRHPFEVAASLAVRNGFETGRSVLMWLRHVLEAEFETRTIKRSFVRFDDLLADWRAVVRRVSVDIGVTWPEQSSLDDGAIATIVRPDLRHHVNESQSTMPLDPKLEDWIGRTMGAMMLLSQSGPAPVDQAFAVLDDVKSEFDAATPTLAPW